MGLRSTINVLRNCRPSGPYIKTSLCYDIKTKGDELHAPHRGVSLVGRLVAGRECHRHDSFNHPFKMDDCGKAIL